MSRRDDRLALAREAGALPLPETGPIAVFRARESLIYGIVGRTRFLCQQSDRPTHDLLSAQGLTVSPDPPGEAAAAIVNATRQRAETLGMLAQALAAVPPGAPVIVAGARKDGIDTLRRQIAAALPLGGDFAKAHGRVLHVARPAALPGVVDDWERAYALAPNAAGFVTGPGMFSPEHPDPGSERLAALLKGRLAGRVADLGAGWGWLAAEALAGNPAIAALNLYEAEARALEAARANVRDPRAGFHWADVTRLPAGAGYDWAITNPPFHRGRAADPALGAAFVAAAARVLKPSGRLLLVANRALPYEAPLTRAFRDVAAVAEDAAYKVIGAARPVRG